MQALAFRSKNEQVYDLLKNQIIRGDLKPGEALVIDALAAQLGVSQIPVREALRHLEANGFVVIAPYIGARVADVEAGSIREVFQTLEALEIVSGRAACELASDADIDAIARRIGEMAVLTGDPEAWSAQNKQLHRDICRAARMTLVEKMLGVALDHWDRLRCLYLDEVFARQVASRQDEHELMLTALLRRDPDALEQAMRYHNQEAFDAYKSYLEKTGVLDTSVPSA